MIEICFYEQLLISSSMILQETKFQTNKNTFIAMQLGIIIKVPKIINFFNEPTTTATHFYIIFFFTHCIRAQ